MKETIPHHQDPRPNKTGSINLKPQVSFIELQSFTRPALRDLLIYKRSRCRSSYPALSLIYRWTLPWCGSEETLSPYYPPSAQAYKGHFCLITWVGSTSLTLPSGIPQTPTSVDQKARSTPPMKIYPSEGLSGHRTPENTCPFKPHFNPSVGRGLILFPLDSCSWRTVIHYIGGQPSRQNLCRFCTYLRDKVRDNIKRQHNFSTPILFCQVGY